MNSAFTKLKLGLGVKDKGDNLKRIDDVNDKNKVTIQPCDYTGILKAKINKTSKVIPGKKYRGFLSAGVLTLKRFKNGTLDKIGIEAKNYRNIIIDLVAVDVLYDEIKCFFLFITPNVSLRAKPKQKEFETWKQMICQHKWYIQFKNKGSITQNKDGLKIPDTEIEDEISDYTEESTKNNSHSSKRSIRVGQKKNQSSTVQNSTSSNISDKLPITSSPSKIERKNSKRCSDNPINFKSPEMIEEMMELIKLLMNTVQTLNERIIKLEMYVANKDGDIMKESSDKSIESKKIKNDSLKLKQSSDPNVVCTTQISEEQQVGIDKISDSAKSALIVYKIRKRRDSLPAVQTLAKQLSYTQIFKCFISGGHFPISLYEPISSLQLLCCELQNAKIINDLVKLTDPNERILKVASYVIGSSADYLIPGRRKCFSSFPGETFDYVSEDGWKFHGEHISKTPMLAASYIEHESWEMYMSFQLISNISFNSVEISSDLPIRLNIKNKESFIWKKPKFVVNKLNDLPEKRLSFYNDIIKIQSSRGLSIELAFDKKGDIEGKLTDNNGKTLADIEGNYYSVVKYTMKAKQYLLYSAPNINSYNEKYYSFNKFTMGINELFPDEIPYIPKSDSRLRKDIRYLEEGKDEKAYDEKVILSDKYRHLNEHLPLWFTKVNDQFSGATLYKSNMKYWPAKLEQFTTEDCQKIPVLFS